jgi:hypothetical protein
MISIASTTTTTTTTTTTANENFALLRIIYVFMYQSFRS